jgi:hypothetical protein
MLIPAQYQGEELFAVLHFAAARDNGGGTVVGSELERHKSEVNARRRKSACARARRDF